MKPHLETITAEQLQVIRSMGPFAAQREMYLAGGTAVALRLGHRMSVDLDWFTSEPISDAMSLAQEIRSMQLPFETSFTARGTLHGTLQGVRVSMLEFTYPTIEPAEEVAELNCRLASIADLSAMKLVAISQRGSQKDFVDVYAIGTAGFTLSQMLDAFQRKYAVQDISRILYSLTFFDDADCEPSPKMLWKVEWQDIKHTIVKWVREQSNC